MAKNISRLFDFITHQKNEYPQEKCYSYKSNNRWLSISTEKFIEQSNTVSRALLNLGITVNDKIAVISSNNRIEWHALDIGLLQIGAQNVPLYPTLSETDYEYILNHSDAIYCFVSDKELLNKVNSVIDKTKLKGIILLMKDHSI